MYKELLNCLAKRPDLYAPSSAPFWEDDHISKGMLAAHLNPNLESATRKYAFVQQSVDWIDQITEFKSGQKLLDLGCGPGIYAELFVDQGFEVTGIDFSKRSIDYAEKSAKENKKHISYFCQNYLDLDEQNAFDVITLIYCDFGVLSPENRMKLLHKIYSALKPGGYFIMDAFTEKYHEDFVEKQAVSYVDGGYWSEAAYVCIQRNLRDEETKTFLEAYHIITENKINCYYIWNHSFDEAGIREVLMANAFMDIDFYSDVTGQSVTNKSPTLCVVCRK